MKYYLLLVTLLIPFIFENTKANNPPSFLKDGNTWCFYSYHYPWDEDYRYYRYVIDGDTVINNRSYKKMYQYDTDKYIPQKTAYVGGVREENRKIYSTEGESEYTSFIDGEVLLYDFSLEQGDLFGTGGTEQEENKAKYIDEINVGGVTRKRIYFSLLETPVSDPYTIWIEGIGSLDRGFFYPLGGIPISSGGNGDWLDMFLENGEIVYGKSDFSFVTEGNHWVERTCEKGNDPQNYQLNRFRMEGDTLINGLTYKKLYKNERPAGALRENLEHKVFYYRDKNTPEIQLYDFHWLLTKKLHLTDFSGNEFEVRTSPPGKTISEMKLEDGKTYHYCDLTENPNSDGQPFLTLNPEVKLIRNIGLTAGIFKMAETQQQEPACYTDLISFYNREGELIYQNPAFDEQGRSLAIEQVRTGKRLLVENQGNRITFTLSDPVIEGQADLRIYRVDGREICTCSIKAGAVTIDNLQSGLYLYRLNGANAKLETGKFTVEN